MCGRSAGLSVQSLASAGQRLFVTSVQMRHGWQDIAHALSAVVQVHSLHDYAEDVVRGLIDKVSFRQNIFVIVVAAQALSS